MNAAAALKALDIDVNTCLEGASVDQTRALAERLPTSS